MSNKTTERLGLVQVYTGNGKGKTTAALGLALRAAGSGMRTYIGQFLKGHRYGELEGIQRLAPYVTLEQFGLNDWVHVNGITTEQRAAALYADRLALLGEGRLLAVGPAAEVLTPARLAQVYGVTVVVTRHPLYGTPLVMPAIDRKQEQR